jgi:hypothetical protein
MIVITRIVERGAESKHAGIFGAGIRSVKL